MKKLNIRNIILSNYQLLNMSIDHLSKNSLNEKTILKSIELDSIVFDIGSNLGNFIYRISKLNKNKTLHFHSFEPNYSVSKIQLDKIKSNKHSLKINNFAVSNTTSETKFYERKISSQSSLYEFSSNKIFESGKKISVKTITIDQYCEVNNIYFINLLKIDTEGHEFNVLNSAKKMFKNNKVDLVKIEIFINNKNLENIINFFNSHNFYLLGTLNHKFIKNELKYLDAYFKYKT